MRDRILVERRFLEIDKPSKDAAFLCAKLFNQFGVIVDKPQFLSNSNVETIANFFSAQIPDGFYKNPQDLSYFTADELIIEQLVSYFTIAINGEQSLNENVFKRNEIFVKALPNYSKGDEIKIRKYELISKEDADKQLFSIANDLCKYTRPWSNFELSEFGWLFSNGFYTNQNLLCKDNAIAMFLESQNENFAKMLDKKDVVKMSLSKFGYQKKLDFSSKDKATFTIALNNVQDCALSLSQAKRFNSIIKNVGVNIEKQNNEKSPYKKAINYMKQGDVLNAAKVFSSSGSLLERNIVFLLSRANIKEAREIVDMLKVDNPISLIQIFLGLTNENYSTQRVFSFYFNKRLKHHVETAEEQQLRKSILSAEIKDFLIEEISKKIQNYYKSKKSLGKIYVSEQFKKVGLPINTSANGNGLDVLPTGSRIKIEADFIRAFCYWYKAFDIDASVVFVKEDGSTDTLFWGNYSKKKFGESALSSGDCRAEDGAEFYDFRIDELKKLGYKYGVFVLNGYCSALSKGEIYCGYQNKMNLNTEAWDAKNIELKIHVKGESRGYIGFALDFETNEVVIINQILNSNRSVVNSSCIVPIKMYLNKGFIENFNMYKILSYRGNVVDKKEDADIVFEDNYISQSNQEVITPYNIEKLVKLLK